MLPGVTQAPRQFLPPTCSGVGGAALVGDRILIDVEDDGRGVQADQIKSAAIEKGLLTKAEAEDLSQGDILALIFRPGFSTAGRASPAIARLTPKAAPPARAAEPARNLRRDTSRLPMLSSFLARNACSLTEYTQDDLSFSFEVDRVSRWPATIDKHTETE